MAIESTTQQSTPIKSAKKKTSRRRRRKTTVPAADADGNVALPTETPPAKKVAQVDVAEVASETVGSGETGAEAGGAGGRTRGRREGRSRRTSKKPAATASTTEAVESASESEAPTPTDASKTTPRRRKPASRGEAESSAAQTEPASETTTETGTSETAPPKRRSRGRRGGKKSKKTPSVAELESPTQPRADDDMKQYINTDLTLVSDQDITSLADLLDKKCDLLHFAEQGDASWLVCVEAEGSGLPDSCLEQDIDRLLSVLESLDGAHRDLLVVCKSPDFNIGWGSPKEEPAGVFELSADLVRRLAALGATLTVTVYPPHRTHLTDEIACSRQGT
ncbi:MAG: hypothetical protein IIB59_00700 [Planctomycetes bacterium]|nr:hypothetical protein [Planctomycetota bacterium]